MIGDKLNNKQAFSDWGNIAAPLARASAANFAGGLTTSLLRGGKTDVVQVAVDAFGNAVGSSLMEQIADSASRPNKSNVQDSGLSFWAKLQIAKEKNDWSGSGSGDGIANFANDNFAIYGSNPLKNTLESKTSILTNAQINLANSNFILSEDPSQGYTSVTNGDVRNGIPTINVTYRYGEGEREQLQRERNAIALERMGQRVSANTNADMMGVSESAIAADIDAMISAGQTHAWNAIHYAAGYTLRKVGYEAWNLATVGFVGRHDERLQAQAEGRLSTPNFWRSTAIDGTVAVASIAAGGRIATSVSSRVGTSYFGNMATGAIVGGSLSGLQQSGENAIYLATNGQSGRYGFSGQEIITNAAFGMALGGGAKLLGEYGNYRLQMTPYRSGTLYSNPLPFELAAPIEIPKGVYADKRGVYGYLPAKGSAYDHPLFDFTDTAFVARNRQIRLDYIDGTTELEKAIASMRASGRTSEEIGRRVVIQRNSQKMESRAFMTDSEVQLLESRNIKAFKNPNAGVGPTPDEMFKKYNDWDLVIQKSLTKDPEINILLGINPTRY